jgi:Mg2+ and Co2+ transporter CorA
VAGVTAGASAAAAATATAALDDLTDEDLSELVCPVFRPDAELADDLRRLLAGLGVPARLARVAQRRVVLPCMLWADAPADSLPAAATAKWPPAPPPPEVASADAAATFDRDRADDVAAPAVRGGFYADDTVATLAPLVAATARNEKLDRGVAAAAPSAAPPIPVGCIVARYFIPRGGAAERLRVIIDTMMSGSTTSARVSRTAQRAIRDAALRWQDWRLHRRLRRAGRATATLQQQQDAADRIKRDGMSQVQNGEVPSDVRNGDAHRLRPYRANAVDPAAAITRLSPDEQQHMRSQHRAVATAAAATRLGRLLGGRDVEDRLVRPHYSQLVDQHPSHGIEDDMGTLRRGVVTADTSEAGTIPLSGTDLRGLDTSTERRRVKKPTTWRGQWRATAAAASRAFAGGGRSQLERHAAASRIGTDTIESTTHRLTFIMLPGRLITIHRVHTPFVRAAMAEFDGRFRDRSPSILVSELIKRCAITFQDGAREEEQLISGLESCFMLRRGEFGAFLVEAHRIGRRAGISRAVLPQLKTTYAETCRLLNLDKTRDVTVRETRSALRTALKLHEDVQETSRSMLMLFFNENAHTLEDLMRVLTVFSTVFIPVTTVAGFFGMPAGWVPWTSEALPPGAAAAATAVTTVVAEVAAAGSSTTADVAIAVASDPAVGLTSPAPPEAPSPVEVTAVAAEDVLTINDQPQEKHGFLKACGVIAAVGFGTLAWVRRRIGRQVI